MDVISFLFDFRFDHTNHNEYRGSFREDLQKKFLGDLISSIDESDTIF